MLLIRIFLTIIVSPLTAATISDESPVGEVSCDGGTLGALQLRGDFHRSGDRRSRDHRGDDGCQRDGGDRDQSQTGHVWKKHQHFEQMSQKMTATADCNFMCSSPHITNTSVISVENVLISLNYFTLNSAQT